MKILLANESDIPSLVALLNTAYRGQVSKNGWTTEADLITGDIRTNAETLLDLLTNRNASFLKHLSDTNELLGCVYLEQQQDKLYLGMLAVKPGMQATGIGKGLMTAADNYAKEKKCKSIFMRVISLREELLAWYTRQGYADTGKREPFPNDGRFGIPVTELEFKIMEKNLI